MSRLLKTSCCNHEYFGINHSPVLETGYCLHCGYHPEIEKLKKALGIAKEKLGYYEKTSQLDLRRHDVEVLGHDSFLTGKRARQALIEIEEILRNKY